MTTKVITIGSKTYDVSYDGEMSDDQLKSYAYAKYSDFSGVQDEDGDNVFDKLLQVPVYKDALVKKWELENDKKFEGNDQDLQDLQEESFEDFNGATNNELLLAKKAIEIGAMTDEGRGVEDTLYNAWTRTAVTGEGSRSLFEQAKDAGDLLWAPSTWLAGKFISGPAMRGGAKLLLTKALAGTATEAQKVVAKKALRSSVVRGAGAGAVYGGGFDAGEQTGIAMNLNDDVEYDPTRTVLTAGVGAVIGGAVGGIIPLGAATFGRKAAKARNVRDVEKVEDIRVKTEEEGFRVKADQEVVRVNAAVNMENSLNNNLEDVVPASKPSAAKELQGDIDVEAKRLEGEGLNKQAAKERANSTVTGGYKVGKLAAMTNGDTALARHAVKLKARVSNLVDESKEFLNNKKKIRVLDARGKPTNKVRKKAIALEVNKRVGNTKGRHPEAVKRAQALHARQVPIDYDKGLVKEQEGLAKRNAEIAKTNTEGQRAAKELDQIENGKVPKGFGQVEQVREFNVNKLAQAVRANMAKPPLPVKDEDLIRVLTPKELVDVKMGRVSPEVAAKVKKVVDGKADPRKGYIPKSLDDAAPITAGEEAVYKSVSGETGVQLRSRLGWFDDLIGGITTRASLLYRPLGLMFQRADWTTTKLAGEAAPLTEKLKSFNKKVDKAGRTQELKDAWNNQNWPELRKMYKELTGDSFAVLEKELRDTLKARHERKSHTRKVKDWDDDLLPRNVKDYDGLIAHIEATRGKVKLTAYHKALEVAARKAGVEVEKLPIEVRDGILTKMYMDNKSASAGRGFKAGTAHDKERTINIVSDDLLQFYDSPASAFDNWNHRTAADVAETEFFKGHAVLNDLGLLEMKDSIGSLINSFGRELPSVDERELRKLIQARFVNGRMPAKAWSQNLRNGIYLTTLTNFLSAMTQLGDLPMGLVVNGLRDSIQVLLHPTRGPSAVDMHFMHVMADEFANETKMAHTLHRFFKWSGFMKVDEMGKNFLLKGAYNRLVRLSKTPEGRAKLVRKNGEKWGEDLNKLMNDAQGVKDGDATDLMKMYLYQELAGVQPVGPSELPVAWHNHPNGRVFYALKTFTLKQLDFMRRDIVHEYAKGNKRDAVGKALMYLMLVPTGNLAVSELKNAVKYQETTDLDGLGGAYSRQLAGLFGMQQRSIEKLASGNIGVALAEIVTPPLDLIEAPVKDLVKLLGGDYEKAKGFIGFATNSDSLTLLPIAGKPSYQVFGAGRESRDAWKLKEDRANY
tara:strand:- start:40 stop:3786 length:3747 start_codon:yes stop_codon:yes gene_type:complete